MHRYLYGYSNPTYYIDPDGHAVCRDGNSFNSCSGGDSNALSRTKQEQEKYEYDQRRAEDSVVSAESKAALESTQREQCKCAMGGPCDNFDLESWKGKNSPVVTTESSPSKHQE